MHTQQVEDRKQVVGACGQVDDMYDSLAAHEQKVRHALRSHAGLRFNLVGSHSGKGPAFENRRHSHPPICRIRL
jgi:hypothetical protein